MNAQGEITAILAICESEDESGTNAGSKLNELPPCAINAHTVQNVKPTTNKRAETIIRI